MQYIDFIIVAFYLLLVIGLGFWYRKIASKDLRAYFLGGNKIHWLALAMSGSVSTFDITGTMWIVSLLFIMGIKSMWVHWMWGFMIGAFCFAFMGKWVRRSNVMTGAEWMVTRFGDQLDGKIARTAYALMAVITQSVFIGYAFQGIGKFGNVYLDLSPTICAVLIISVTTLYVLLGGLFSVVITDVIQTLILSISGIVIAIIAYTQVTPEMMNTLLPSGWESIKPVWHIQEFAGTENAQYEWFGLLVIAWVMKGFLLNAGGPAQMYDFQRFLSARTERQAAMIGASWSFFLIIRWAMAMGIVMLALHGLSDSSDPEKVMPMVLYEYLPVGFRGLVIAGLLAAFMSTFSSTVNSAASYVVRDFWQTYAFPNAGQRHLIRASYASTLAIVILGILIGRQAQSIAQIFNWLMMALGASVVMPNVLRWYWWRLNGWGYAMGTFFGIILSTLPLFQPDMPMYKSFPIIAGGTFIACVVASYLTRPVNQDLLIRFYEIVKPFGLWKPIAQQCSPQVLEEMKRPYENKWYSIFNTCVGMVAIGSLYLFPMYLVGHWHGHALLYITLALLSMTILYFTWYRYLPED